MTNIVYPVIFPKHLLTTSHNRVLRSPMYLEEKKMDKEKIKGQTFVMIAIAIASVVVLAAVGAYQLTRETEPEDRLVDIEEIGGKYDARIEHWQMKNPGTGQWFDHYKIRYELNGEQQSGVLMHEHRAALDWLQVNTGDDAVIMSWWDYGHAVRGYSQREPVADGPSESLRETMADKGAEVSHWESEERLKDLATALTSEAPEESKAIMNEYGADYVYVARRDVNGIEWAMFKAAGTSDKYIDQQDGSTNDAAYQTLIFRLWGELDVEGFELAYKDTYVKIYEIV